MSKLHPSLTRRRFLQSMGAAAPIFLPILHSERLFAQNPSNKRSLFYFTFNGSPHDAYAPTGFGCDSSTNFDKSAILRPLAAHRTDLNVFSGIRTEVGHGRQQGHYTIAGWLTGHQASSPKDAAVATHPSLDAFISQRLGFNRALSVGIIPTPSVYSTLSWGMNLQEIRPIANPKETWNALFANFESIPPDPLEFENYKKRRLAIYDSVHSDLNNIKNYISGAERDKIESHIASILKIRLDIQNLELEDLGQCGFTQPTGTFGDNDQAVKGITPAVRDLIADLQIRMATEALKCGIVTTATIVVGSKGAKSNLDLRNYQGPNGNVTHAWHQASHHATKGGAAAKNSHIGYNHWHAKNVANIITRMKALNIFNNSVVVWGNEYGDSNRNHTHDNMTMVVAGSLGGYFRVGQYLKLPGTDAGTNGNSYNQFNQTCILTAVGRGMGVLTANEKWGSAQYAQNPPPGLIS